MQLTPYFRYDFKKHKKFDKSIQTIYVESNSGCSCANTLITEKISIHLKNFNLWMLIREKHTMDIYKNGETYFGIHNSNLKNNPMNDNAAALNEYLVSYELLRTT